MLTGYQAPAIVMAAHKLGVFRELAGGQATAATLADRLGVPKRSLGILLRGCVALDLLTIEDECYSCTPFAAETLIPDKPGYLGRLVDKEAFFYEAWGDLTSSVRTDQAALASIQVRLREEPDITRNFLLALDDIAALFGGEFASHVDLTDHRRLLDIGGGVGSYTVALAERYPLLEATILDLPEVVPWAQAFVAMAGMDRRISVEPHDFLVDTFPRGCDAILLSNIFHDHPPTVNQGLLTKAYEALVDGGQVIVYDFLLESDRVAPASAALFAVMMLIENQGGNVYTVPEIESWLASAGFQGVTIKRMPNPSPMGLLAGYKQPR
jgi:hypothetical protein